MDSEAATGSSSSTSSTVSITVLFLLRVLTFVFLLISLILTVTNKIVTEDTDYGSPVEVVMRFSHFHSFRYLISTIVIGFAYTIMQMALLIFSLVSGKRALSGDVGYLCDFFGDKIVSYLLVSGSAAGFATSGDLKTSMVLEDPSLNSFIEKADASATLLLIAFLFTAVASVFTSFALPKKA